MDQTSLFPEALFWIPEVDNNCRMWRCPKCRKRMVGQPLHWAQFNYYRFCPYCGTKLETDSRHLSREYCESEEEG